MEEPSPTTPRRGITEKDVWKAADTLLLEGRRPTIESVRQQIGRGSPNTITPYLDTWFKGLGRRLHDPAGYAPAPAVPEPIAAAATHFWESALSVARGELRSEREILEEAQSRLAQEREQLALESKRMAAAEAALNEALALAKEQLANSVARGDRLVARNDALEAEIRTVKAQLQSSRDELDVERRERAADARQATELLNAERDRFEANERRWMQETDAARTAAKAAQAQAQRASDQLAAARRDWETEREAARDAAATLQARVTEVQALLDGTTLALERATAEREALKAELSQAQSRYDQDAADVRKQLAEALRAIGRVTRVHATATRS